MRADVLLQVWKRLLLEPKEAYQVPSFFIAGKERGKTLLLTLERGPSMPKMRNQQAFCRMF